MEWSDHVIVLRIGHFRESDLWLKLLCKKQGLQTAFAFGGSRSHKRFCGCLDIFNTLHCHIKTNNRHNFVTLQEAVLLDGPKHLRKNWQRMGLATNCIRFLEAIGVNEECAQEAFIVIEDMRNALENNENIPSLFPLFFRFRIASALGFAPNLYQCDMCNKNIEKDAVFLLNEGQIRCTSCLLKNKNHNPYIVTLTNKGLDLLRFVQQKLPSSWPIEEITLNDKQSCAHAIDGFVQYHLGLAWLNNHFQHV